jgi:hypothetical protein
MAWQAWQGGLGPGMDFRGGSSHGRRGQVCCGKAGHNAALLGRQGEVGAARQCEVGRDMTRQGFYF